MRQVWIRIGDQGDYEAFSDLEDAGAEIAYTLTLGGERDNRRTWTPERLTPPYGRLDVRGLAIPQEGFSGDNYISVFLAGRDPNAEVTGLTDIDFDILEAAILNCDVD